ncbi:MAG: glutamate--tRNA ligase family protein, partial [Myxococcota bacterium]
MSHSSVVTRYAPSPTGALHIGGARTALFSWAFARHHGGRFLLRIEDTDRERSTLESEKLVLEALDWIGLDWDPVPGFSGNPRQSERGARYRGAIAELLANGHAYRCTCSEAEVEA